MQLHLSTDLDIAWAAGFIDGEGCFHIGRVFRKTRPVYVATLSVGQVKHGPLERLQRIFGGNIYLNREQRANMARCYQWRIHSAAAIEATKLLLPHLSLKGPQAMVILRFGEGVRNNHHIGRRGLTEEEVARRDGLRDEMTLLNRRGPQ